MKRERYFDEYEQCNEKYPAKGSYRPAAIPNIFEDLANALFRILQLCACGAVCPAADPLSTAWRKATPFNELVSDIITVNKVPVKVPNNAPIGKALFNLSLKDRLKCVTVIRYGHLVASHISDVQCKVQDH